MDSTFAKTQVLSYWRFKRQFNYCGTEVGRWSADVLVSDGERVFEIETKVSKADLLNDFKSKKQKHFLYQNPEKRTSHYKKTIPTSFFFAVPKQLVEKAVEISKPMGYGVLEVLEASGFGEPCCRIILKPKVLNEDVHEDLIFKIVSRETSELISLRSEIYKLKNNEYRKLLKKFAREVGKLFIKSRTSYQRTENSSISNELKNLYNRMMEKV